jgi:hypothetical protein
VLKASRYIGLEIPLSNAGNLLYDSRVLRAEMSDRYGVLPKFGGVWEQIERGLQDIAGVNHSTEAHDIVGGWFRGNFATGQLGFNLFTVLRQLSGLPLYMKDVPITHLLKGFYATSTDYSETIKRIEEYSPMFYERVRGGYSRDIQDALRKLDKNQRMFGTTSFFRHPIQRLKGTVMKPTQMVDKITVAMGMEGAKEYVLDMFKSGNWDKRVLDRLGLTEQEAKGLTPEERLQMGYRYADWVTTQTQPVSSKMYRSGVSRSGNFFRLMTMYTEQTNALMNMWSQAFNESGRTGNKSILMKTFMAMAINSGWQVFVSNIVRGLMLKDDYEPDWDKLLVDFIGDMIFGPIYFAPDLIRYLRGEGKYQHPLHAVTERIFRGASNIIKSFSTPNARKAEKQLSSGVSMLASGAGSVMGIPLGPTWTLWQAVQKATKKLNE